MTVRVVTEKEIVEIYTETNEVLMLLSLQQGDYLTTSGGIFARVTHKEFNSITGVLDIYIEYPKLEIYPEAKSETWQDQVKT